MIVEPSIMWKYAHTLWTIWKIKDFPHPVGSIANTSFRLMKWSKASSWTGFNSRILEKPLFHRKLYCTTKGSLEFVWSFFEQKKQLLGLLRSIPEIRPVRVLVRSLSLEKRSGAKFEHQSATEFKICTHGSEVRSCRDQRVFFFALVTIAASPLNFCRKQQEKNPLAPRVIELPNL